jgi:hypothetical protein
MLRGARKMSVFVRRLSSVVHRSLSLSLSLSSFVRCGLGEKGKRKENEKEERRTMDDGRKTKTDAFRVTSVNKSPGFPWFDISRLFASFRG